MFTMKQTLLSALSFVALAAGATPTTSQIVLAQETPLVANTVPTGISTIRNSFLAERLANTVGSFGFEGTALSGASAPIDAIFAGSGASTITATIDGSGRVTSGAQQGRFNTTVGGSQYWEVQSVSTGTFSITFDRAISAFGFLGTDIGDFQGLLKLILTPAAGGADDVITIRDSAADAALNGSVLFFGFADANSRYSKITFQTAGSGTDYFGFDDFFVADSGQVLTTPNPTPEPGSLALVGLALAAAALAGSRRRA